ncbi:putative polyadenylate-binding protein/Hyperplastic disc protein [Helianthus annuus]|nr:putative polyadenylate-binding protein/Hyperplastic disc protein [Helianthus annuus]
MADVEEKLLNSLGWKKSDFIKEGHHVEEKLLNSLGWKKYFIKEGHLEAHYIRMYYEFGIFSTVYGGKGMPEWIRCRSRGSSISFIIPSSPKKLRGLNFCCVNLHPFSVPRIKISNITKKQTWIYEHYTHILGEDCYSWLSHWMFGPNEMKAGDNIIIECGYRTECVVGVVYDIGSMEEEDSYKMECGVGVVYDDGSMEEEEDVLSYYKSWNHIIGGDLSAFQRKTGEYYLYHWEFHNKFSRDSHNKFYGARMVPFGLMYSHPPGSDAGNVLMASVPYDVEKAMHLPDAGGIFALTNASPTEQRTMPGEYQYPPLEQLEAESEATVTTDFLRLLESPEARKAKVAEAMEIEQGSPAHELASFLSL